MALGSAKRWSPAAGIRTNIPGTLGKLVGCPCAEVISHRIFLEERMAIPILLSTGRVGPSLDCEVVRPDE